MEQVDLELVPRRELGRRDTIRSRITFGTRPLAKVPLEAVPMTDLERAAAAQIEGEFYVCHAVLTFWPVRGEVFDHGKLSAKCNYLDAEREDSVEVFDILPMRSDAPVEISSTLSATAKLGGLVELSSATAEKATRTDSYITGYGKGENVFEWDVRASDSRSIDGSHDLVAVLRAAPDERFEIEFRSSGAVWTSSALIRFSTKIPETVRVIRSG
jgi:hypothetical protein